MSHESVRILSSIILSIIVAVGPVLAQDASTGGPKTKPDDNGGFTGLGGVFTFGQTPKPAPVPAPIQIAPDTVPGTQPIGGGGGPHQRSIPEPEPQMVQER